MSEVDKPRACASCTTEYPEHKFKLRSSTGRQAGTRQARCNRCLYLLYTRPEAERKQAEVHAYKLEKGCADCGYNLHPSALEFDHLPGTVKLFNIGEKVGSYSRAKLWAEIAKCEVVCANCHAIRTTERRVRVDWE